MNMCNVYMMNSTCLVTTVSVPPRSYKLQFLFLPLLPLKTFHKYKRSWEFTLYFHLTKEKGFAAVFASSNVSTNFVVRDNG